MLYQDLRHKLINEVGFKQSQVDECVFYRGTAMYALYTEDSLLAWPSLQEIDQAIQDIRHAKLDITIKLTFKTSWAELLIENVMAQSI